MIYIPMSVQDVQVRDVSSLIFEISAPFMHNFYIFVGYKQATGS